MKLTSRLVLTLLAITLWDSRVRAQPSAADAIQLDVPDCEDVPGANVRDLIALEVAPRPVLAAASSETAATRAVLSCSAGVATIVVEDVAPVHLEIAITLSELARPARARSLALAVAELIATSRLQRPQPRAAVTEAEAEPDVEADEPPPPLTPEESGVQLWLGLGAVRSAEPSMIAPAASLGALLYWNALALAADVRAERAQATQSVAELQLYAGSLALAPTWRLHASSADLLIGVGARAGYASLLAAPREPMLAGLSVAGFWLAPCAQVAVHARLARHWALRIGAEVAYVTRTLRGLDASGAPLLELRGLMIAAQLGVSWDQNE